jgi:hypothetical protein
MGTPERHFYDCALAKDRLGALKQSVTLKSFENAPRDYFPHHQIRHFFEKPGENLSLESIFTCTCLNCKTEFGLNDQNARKELFLEYEGQLRGAYGSIYALLISIGHAGLIGEFLKRRVTFEDAYLSDRELQFLLTLKRLEGLNRSFIIEEIIGNQYRFHVRPLDRQTSVAHRHKSEVLPVNEKSRRGRGNFGEVYSIDVHEGYVGPALQKLGVSITAWTRS